MRQPHLVHIFQQSTVETVGLYQHHLTKIVGNGLAIPARSLQAHVSVTGFLFTFVDQRPARITECYC
jgi:hypothetical protein